MFRPFLRQRFSATERDFEQALNALGLDGSQNVIAHTSLSSFGHFEGAQAALVRSLKRCVATLVVPTFSYAMSIDASEIENHRSEKQFRRFSPVSRDLGRVAQHMVDDPQSVRSFHPLLSFAAQGTYAHEITGAQSLENPYAPIGALYDLDGWVLLLGVGMSSNTSVHYGEHLAGQVLLPRWVLIDGVPKQTWFPNCSGAFSRLHKGLKTDRRSVTLGRATLEAYPVRAVVDLAHLRVSKDPEALLCGFSGCRCQDVRKRVRAQGLSPRIHQVSIQDTPH